MLLFLMGKSTLDYQILLLLKGFFKSFSQHEIDLQNKITVLSNAFKKNTVPRHLELTSY